MNIRINWRRELRFWSFQLLGWMTWIVMLVLRDLTFVPREYILERVNVFVVDALIGMALTTALRYLYRSVWDRPVYVRFLAVMLGCWLASQAWRPIKVLITDSDFGASVDLTGYGWNTFSNWLPISMSLLLLWSMLYFMMKYYQLFHYEREKSLRSESLAHEAQLRMLRYQLNPHFLFNTLNAISTLILVQSTDQANAMVTRLSKFLRYSLEHDPLDKVTLEHELASVNLYLDIEKVRFEERLRVEYDLPDSVRQALVPSMLLQPMVENSIKYAIARHENGGTIWISASPCDRNKLCITVADDGPGAVGDPTSIGVGLKNIRDRLQEIYGDEHQFLFSPQDPKGFKVTVVIPYETR
ncbi:MAG: histidine kinase [Pseudomonadota bacterium]|nr:sensor histidine kinase [Gammaproteobacteria bacterium]MBJ56190.1 sensor histidine kinase [Gammaproteobacteria bacterium]MEC8859173.1 histidine kinase [Pseudomonadota bacterium]HBN14477.1 sensor histidine kinase [Pseudohongiella sp.]|tara:strand:- start:1547 stop:2614 length:1068 start_codon:yes stop_codon:yes gene_type:complete